MVLLTNFYRNLVKVENLKNLLKNACLPNWQNFQISKFTKVTHTSCGLPNIVRSWPAVVDVVFKHSWNQRRKSILYLQSCSEAIKLCNEQCDLSLLYLTFFLKLTSLPTKVAVKGLVGNYGDKLLYARGETWPNLVLQCISVCTANRATTSNLSLFRVSV